ncbi:hypothetical protein F5887DRAFT_976896 [Amanita rubescens]|nr:hypothetical protein F5887DRAFT_976896 [Amanita rubescens]
MAGPFGAELPGGENFLIFNLRTRLPTSMYNLFSLSGAWIQALFHFLARQLTSSSRTMHLTDVPLDVQLQILQLCSPKDLAVISRVHSSLRDAAEHVLYSRIDFSTQQREYMHRSPWDSAAKKTAPLLSTLANNTWKASTVKAFYIELGVEDDNCDALHLILVELAGVLEKMPNLVDLRILNNALVDLSEGMISKVIGGGYFKLETLYLNFYWHDLEGVIAGQPQLRFLGLYDSDYSEPLIWREVKGLYQIKNCHCRHTSSGPAIFILDFFTFNLTREITIFPVFHRSVDAPQVFQQISVHPKIHDLYYEDRYYVSLSLFGISEDNINLFCEVLEAMEICSRHRLYSKLTRKSYKTLKIIVHETTIQKPWLSPEFTKSLAQFKSVRQLQLDFPNIEDTELYSLSVELRECLLKGLGHGEWARLQSIDLQGPRNRVFLDRGDNWVPEDEHW